MRNPAQQMQMEGRAPVPYIYSVIPNVAIAAGATVQVSITNGPRIFTWTHIGWTSAPVGIPAQGQKFRVLMQDVGADTRFQNRSFDLTALTGGVPFLNDAPPFELPVPWDLGENNQLTFDFTNIGTLACTPEFLAIGYLK